MARKVYATGTELFIEEDRRRLYVTSGIGNSPAEEVHLEYLDPETGVQLPLGWFDAKELIYAAKMEAFGA